MIDLNSLADELLNSSSRYHHDLNVVNYDNCNMYDIPYSFVIKNDNDDEYVSVTSEYFNRLDKIASDYYTDPKYWWIIALLNDIPDPFLVGSNITLRLPSINKLIMKEVI